MGWPHFTSEEETTEAEQRGNTGPKFEKKVQVMCLACFDFPKVIDLPS